MALSVNTTTLNFPIRNLHNLTLTLPSGDSLYAPVVWAEAPRMDETEGVDPFGFGCEGGEIFESAELAEDEENCTTGGGDWLLARLLGGAA